MSRILMLLIIAVGVVDCRPSTPEKQALDAVPPLVLSAAACRRKGFEAMGEAGGCEEKRARLYELLRTDPDCIALYADAAPELECRPTDGGSHGD